MSAQLDRALIGASSSSSPSGSSLAGNQNESTRPPYLQTGVLVAVRYPYMLQVRLSCDRHLPDATLPWAYPLLPPGWLPKVGELVRVFLPNPGEPQAERYWTGPVLTGYQHLPGQPYPGQLFTTNDRSWSQLSGDPAQYYPATDSRYPHPDTPERVHLLTRGNSDVVCPPNGTYLRAGRHDWADPRQPNTRNTGLVAVSADPTTQTTTAFVRADTIALFSGTPGPEPDAAADPLAPTAVEANAAASTAHPLAFADVLARQLEVFRQALLDHAHPGPGKAAVKDQRIRELQALDFSLLGSLTLVGR